MLVHLFQERRGLIVITTLLYTRLKLNDATHITLYVKKVPVKKLQARLIV